MSEPKWITRIKEKQGQATKAVDPAPVKKSSSTPAWITKIKKEQEALSGISKTDSAARGALQEASWGFSDEVTGAIDHVFTRKTYDQSVAESRKKFRDAEKANPKAFIAGGIAGTVLRDGGLMFIPGFNFFRTASILRGTAIGGGDGALRGLGTSDELGATDTVKKIAEESLWGAAGFAAVAGVFKAGKAVIKARKPKHPAHVQAINDTLSVESIREGVIPSQASIEAQVEIIEDSGLNIWRDATRLAKRDTKRAKVYTEGPKKWPNKLINWKLNRPTGAAVSADDFRDVEELWKGIGAEGRKSTVQNFIMGESIQKAFKNSLKTKQGKKYVAEMKDPLESEAFAKARAPTQNADLVDLEVKTNMRGIVSRLAKSEDMSLQGAAPFLTRQYKLSNKAKKAGLTNDEIYGNMIGRTGKTLNRAQNGVIKEYRKWFDDAREALIKDGLEIEHLDNYFPRMTQNAIDSRVTMTTELKRLRSLGDKADPDDVESFDTTVRWLFPDLEEGASDKEILNAFESMTNIDVSKMRGMLPEAFAVFSRKESGGTPTLLQERDVSKVMTNYILMNYKALHSRAPMEELQSHITLFRGMELNNTAKIWEDYYRQLSSMPGNFQAALNGTSAAIKVKGRELMNEGGLMAKGGEVVNEVPEFASWLSTQIYPNYLGWNLNAPLRNLAQTWLVTAPELRGAYGYATVAKGWYRATKAMAAGENPGKFLDDNGLRAPDFNNEGAINSMSDNIGVLGAVGKGIDKIGKIGLKFFGATDSANRYLTYHTAQQVVEDIIAQKKSVQPFLERMREGPRQVVLEAMLNGDKRAINQEVTNYLIDKTQFKYNRADMSQYAREYGRVYAMFSKWPTMMIGDLEYSARARKGATRVLEPMGKYAAPFLLLTGAKKYIESTGEMDPKLQLFIGRDLSKISPMSAVLGLQAPPLLQIPAAGIRALEAASQGEVKKAAKELGGALEPFTPGIYFKKMYEKREGIIGLGEAAVGAGSVLIDKIKGEE